MKDVGSDWAVYLGVAKDYSETVEQDENNLLKFWNVHRLSIPKLYELSKWILAFPTNTAEVERSFSSYNKVLTKNRNKLTEESVAALNFIHFNNKRFVIEEDGDDDDDIFYFENEEEEKDDDESALNNESIEEIWI